MYADNLLEVVREVQRNVENGEKLNELDLDFDVVVGKAKNGVRTEAQFNAVDKVVDRIQKTKVGKFANETTVASAVSIAYSLGAVASKKLANSKLFAWGSFGATAAMGAGIAGLREKKRLEEERRQHGREMAMGKTFSPDKSPRRKEMEEFRYEAKEASALTDALEQSIYRISEDGTREIRDLSQEELQTALANLAEIESRIKISDREKVDLISYSNVTKVSDERLRLDILRAQAKVDLRKLTTGEVKHPGNEGKEDVVLGKELKIPEGKSLDEFLTSLTGGRIESLIKGDEGMEKRDALFKAMRNKRVAKAVVKGLVTGLIIGGVAQEVGAFFKEGSGGIEMRKVLWKATEQLLKERCA